MDALGSVSYSVRPRVCATVQLSQVQLAGVEGRECWADGIGDGIGEGEVHEPADCDDQSKVKVVRRPCTLTKHEIEEHMASTYHFASGFLTALLATALADTELQLQVSRKWVTISRDVCFMSSLDGCEIPRRYRCCSMVTLRQYGL